MATRAQAKSAIDAASISAKANIDLLPATANIDSGSITFSPNKMVVFITAIDEADALSIVSTLKTNLTTAGRTFSPEARFGKRRTDTQKIIVLQADIVTFRITFA